jgi:hypothetical protein
VEEIFEIASFPHQSLLVGISHDQFEFLAVGFDAITPKIIPHIRTRNAVISLPIT